ncbi:MAG: hypothetical protein ACAI44_26190 [Candidatus Sericytochromatia bacterium]
MQKSLYILDILELGRGFACLGGRPGPVFQQETLHQTGLPEGLPQLEHPR